MQSLLSVEKNWVRDPLSNPNPYTDYDSDGYQPSMPSELADASIRLFSIRFERFRTLGWLKKSKRSDRSKKKKKKAKNNLGDYQLLRLPSAPGEIMEQILSKVLSGHMKGKMMTGNSRSDLPWIYFAMLD